MHMKPNLLFRQRRIQRAGPHAHTAKVRLLHRFLPSFLCCFFLAVTVQVSRWVAPEKCSFPIPHPLFASHVGFFSSRPTLICHGRYPRRTRTMVFRLDRQLSYSRHCLPSSMGAFLHPFDSLLTHDSPIVLGKTRDEMIHFGFARCRRHISNGCIYIWSLEGSIQIKSGIKAVFALLLHILPLFLSTVSCWIFDAAV